MPKLSVIVPFYFNEENIPDTTARLIANESLFPKDVTFEYVFVDDGSKDKTFERLVEFRTRFPEKVKLIRLMRNFGSYNAILAGMNYATGDCCTVITADLQDPPELIPKMYEHWQRGIKLVIANRQYREESFLQRAVLSIYYSLFRRFAMKNIPGGGFDFALFDRTLKEEVVNMNEKNTNQLYLLNWLYHDYVTIPYTRKKREKGRSRWTLSKKIKLFIDTFVSFSFFPVRLISVIGLLLGLISFIYGIFIIVCKLSGSIRVEGWTATMLVLLMVSSFQMIALGVLGEYLWRILDEVRKRPNFVIEKKIDESDKA
jgi:polyisoprenyl-phosphate glycosyltransferase